MRTIFTPLLFAVCCACAFPAGNAFASRGLDAAAAPDDACGTESDAPNSNGGAGGDAVAVTGDGEDASSVARDGRDGESSRPIDIRIDEGC